MQLTCTYISKSSFVIYLQPGTIVFIYTPIIVVIIKINVKENTRELMNIRHSTTQAPHITWLFTVYYRDMSGKELEMLYGNFNHGAVLVFLFPICVLV